MKSGRWKLLMIIVLAGTLLGGCTQGKGSAAPDSVVSGSASAASPTTQSSPRPAESAETPIAQAEVDRPPAFKTTRNADGSLAVTLAGRDGDYLAYSSPAIELQGSVYHMVNLYYGDYDVTNALLSHRPGEDEVKVLWSESLNGLAGSKNLRYNSFHSGNERRLAKLDDNHALFLEPEITDGGGSYHLSTLDVNTGEIKRVREDFWPLDDDYDYIYQYRWDAERKQLFMQSYLGYVWFFDLEGGKDRVPQQKLRVIPHSTTGAPSLFLSPNLDRFVHDDESGEITFYEDNGQQLKRVRLPAGRYVPSEKIKWNPAGTIALLESAPEADNRITGIDIDFMSIAPQRIDFFDPDGNPIGSIEAEGGKDRALEVVRWMDDNVAVVKTYKAVQTSEYVGAIEEKDISYYLYDVLRKKKSRADVKAEAQLAASGQTDAETKPLVTMEENHKIVYPNG